MRADRISTPAQTPADRIPALGSRRVHRRRGVVTTLRLTLLSVIAVSVACAEFDTVTDPSFGLPDVAVATPSFASDIQPIFDRRCSIGGCHSLATAQAGLVLDATESYNSLVGVESLLRPEFLRVEPFDAADSWLVRMIGSDPAARFGHERMPLAARPLTPNQIATIVNWINQGALRN